MGERTKKIYFASDLHLGMHPLEESRQREKLFIEWMKKYQDDMAELWLLGDVFDYWFEYRKVIPRGYSRFIGKLAELSDSGVKIHIFTGNHDVWMFDYFPSEIGAVIHHGPEIIRRNGKVFHLSHGDGLSKKDPMYNFIKAVFKSKFLQWCYARIHPNGSASFAQWWSRKSRYSKDFIHPFKGEENEEQILFARKYSANHPEINYFLFGHRHVPYDVPVSDSCRAVCLGEWFESNSYGVFDGTEFRLEYFRKA